MIPRPCHDCGLDVSLRGGNPELYMVRHELWERHVGWRACTETEVIGPGSIHLCVGCLEARMGRRLNADDFTGAPCNWDDSRRTPRLQRRLQRRLVERIPSSQVGNPTPVG